MQLLNVPMLKEPINWLIVILMLAIFVAGLTLLQPSLGAIETATMKVV